jgi:hypothetical protein
MENLGTKENIGLEPLSDICELDRKLGEVSIVDNRNSDPDAQVNSHVKVGDPYSLTYREQAHWIDQKQNEAVREKLNKKSEAASAS